MHHEVADAPVHLCPESSFCAVHLFSVQSAICIVGRGTSLEMCTGCRFSAGHSGLLGRPLTSMLIKLS